MSLLAEYLTFLTDNRRMSPHSVRAYHATADRLTAFLQLHWGSAVDRATLMKISAADMRAFLADRRGDGLTNRSTARELSAIRHFLRFALGDNATLPAMKGPRVQRSLPRPVNPDDVLALADDVAESANDGWVGARDWALLLLLYGSGIGNPNVHDHTNLPVLVAGGAAGGMKGGRHIRYKEPTPLANLHLSLLDKVGVKLDRFGDSSGKMDEIFQPLSV